MQDENLQENQTTTKIDLSDKTIEEMSDEELNIFLSRVRTRRKKGFERKQRKKNPLANLSPNELAEVLKRLEGK